MTDPLRELRDQREIEALLARYASALDARDWERLSSCFTTEAVAEYGGPLGRCVGANAVVEACRRTLEPLDASHHLIGSIEIEVETDTAHSHCAFQAQHVRKGCEGGSNFLLGGHYRDELVRTSEGWRIRHRELLVSWRDGNPRVLADTR
jgi:3-phenylpropionate/cinnamic acid dioxygenase small subunit